MLTLLSTSRRIVSVVALGGVVVASVAAASLAPSSAEAQTFSFGQRPAAAELNDPFANYRGELAPGYLAPDARVAMDERELFLPYGDTNVDEYRYDQDSPLNEFAGQRFRTNNGLFGNALGAVKTQVFGF